VAAFAYTCLQSCVYAMLSAFPRPNSIKLSGKIGQSYVSPILLSSFFLLCSALLCNLNINHHRLPQGQNRPDIKFYAISCRCILSTCRVSKTCMWQHPASQPARYLVPGTFVSMSANLIFVLG